MPNGQCGYECQLANLTRNGIFYVANLSEKSVPVMFRVIDAYNKCNPKRPLDLQNGQNEPSVEVRVLHRPHQCPQVTDILRIGV